MRLINRYYTGPKSLDALTETVPDDATSILVQIYSRCRGPAAVRRLISAVRARLPSAQVVGMTCYGTIVGEEVSRRDTLISVLHSRHVTIACSAGEAGSSDTEDVRTLGKSLAARVASADTRCLVVFTNYDGVEPDALLDGINAACPGVPVAGGKAAQDPDDPGATLVWCNDIVTECGAVVVALNGADLYAYQEFNLGVETMGKVFQVTRGEHGRVMELDGEPVVEIYRRYLGQDVADNLPRSILGFPVVVEREGTEIAVDAVELYGNGAIRYALPLHVGEHVRFAFPHAERMFNGAAALGGRLRAIGSADALLIFVCSSHLWTLGEGAGVETAMLAGIGPVVGCLTGGEFCRIGNGNRYLNQSMTVLMLREKTQVDLPAPASLPTPPENETVSVHLRTVKVLHGMISRMTNELACANTELQRERAFYRTLIEEMLDGLCLIDADGRCIFESPSNVAIHGWSSDVILGTQVLETLVHPDEQAVVRGIWQRMLNSPEGRERLITRIRHRSGRWIIIEAQSRNCLDIPEIRAVVTYFRDVTELKHLETELRRLATTDSLTMLPNRRHFLERARQEQHRSARNGTSLSVLLMDIDFFKRINDTHGHAAGDRVLVCLAGLLQSKMRDQDVVGRIGGEEFAILLPDTNSLGALMLAERLRVALESYRVAGAAKRPLQITASFGVACLRAGEGTIDRLLRQADEALYRAKETGRNRVCVAERTVSND
ncbi:MAG: diguanylate cyclase [Aquisalimonadaceae bacterium]